VATGVWVLSGITYGHIQEPDHRDICHIDELASIVTYHYTT